MRLVVSLRETRPRAYVLWGLQNLSGAPVVPLPPVHSLVLVPELGVCIETLPSRCLPLDGDDGNGGDDADGGGRGPQGGCGDKGQFVQCRQGESEVSEVF